MKKYNIDFTEEQLRIVATACEFYSRFCAGQWGIPDEMQFNEFKLQEKYDGFWNKRNYIQEQFEALKQNFTGLRQHESYGIGSDNLSIGAKTAYDIYRPILEQFTKESNEKNPEIKHYSVYDSPGLTYSNEGRIEIKIKDENS